MSQVREVRKCGNPICRLRAYLKAKKNSIEGKIFTFLQTQSGKRSYKKSVRERESIQNFLRHMKE